MLLQTSEKQCTGGMLDFICILRSIQTGRFHPCFVEERPMPGPVPDMQDTKFIRAKSKMHHTGGFDTFEEAVAYTRKNMCAKLSLPEDNIALDHAINWDSDNVAFVVLLPNWRTCGKTLDEVLKPDILCEKIA